MFRTIVRGLRWAPLAAALALPSLAQAQFAPDWRVDLAAQVVAPALAVDGGRNSVLAATLTGQPVTVHKFGPTGTAP